MSSSRLLFLVIAGVFSSEVPIWYFFVNRTDKTAPPPESITTMVKKYENEATEAGITTRIEVCGFERARSVVAAYDAELATLWDELNLAYATVHSNIFRLAILRAHGGIYHDAKCWLHAGPLKAIVGALELVDIVFEERMPPSRSGKRRVRATNMAAARPGLGYFDEALQRMKAKLLREREEPRVASHDLIYRIGSHSMLDVVAKNVDNRTMKGHLSVGYRCSKRGPAARPCGNGPIRGHFVENSESFFVMEWHVNLEGKIIDAYNRHGNRHWSRIHEHLFSSPSNQEHYSPR